MRYFTNCKTAEELRKEFHRLAKELHPDNGGNAEDFKAMKAEFEKAWETVGNTYKNAEGETYQKKEQTMTAPEFESIIEKLIHWTDCKIEIIGSWLWISGNTYSHRSELKEMHFGFSKNKKAWYFHEGDFRKRSKKSFSMDDIRGMFGSDTVDTTAQPTLA